MELKHSRHEMVVTSGFYLSILLFVMISMNVSSYTFCSPFVTTVFGSSLHVLFQSTTPSSKNANNGNGKKSRMPSFNAEEQEELRKILNEEYSEEDVVGLQFSDDDGVFREQARRSPRREAVPSRISPPNPTVKKTSSSSNTLERNPPASKAGKQIAPVSKVLAPNPDWRSALSNTDKSSKSSIGSTIFDMDRNRRDFKRPPVQPKRQDDFAFDDLDYDDFEQVMLFPSIVSKLILTLWTLLRR